MMKIGRIAFGTFFFVLIPLILFSACSKAQDCKGLPISFSSYEQALKTIKSTHFKVVETVNTSKSSWIRGAKYYSCDGASGYLMLTTDQREYIHAYVPIEVWRTFKNASSFGQYYNKHIKGQYRITITP